MWSHTYTNTAHRDRCVHVQNTTLQRHIDICTHAFTHTEAGTRAQAHVCGQEQMHAHTRTELSLQGVVPDGGGEARPLLLDGPSCFDCPRGVAAGAGQQGGGDRQPPLRCCLLNSLLLPPLGGKL